MITPEKIGAEIDFSWKQDKIQITSGTKHYYAYRLGFITGMNSKSAKEICLNTVDIISVVKNYKLKEETRFAEIQKAYMNRQMTASDYLNERMKNLHLVQAYSNIINTLSALK